MFNMRRMKMMIFMVSVLKRQEVPTHLRPPRALRMLRQHTLQ
jgi:hypothetical protein